MAPRVGRVSQLVRQSGDAGSPRTERNQFGVTGIPEWLAWITMSSTGFYGFADVRGVRIELALFQIRFGFLCQ